MNINKEHPQVIYDIFHMSKPEFIDVYKKNFGINEMDSSDVWDDIRENNKEWKKKCIKFTQLSIEKQNEIKKEIVIEEYVSEEEKRKIRLNNIQKLKQINFNG